jgi:apolipoprotein N-acyltransferase
MISIAKKKASGMAENTPQTGLFAKKDIALILLSSVIGFTGLSFDLAFSPLILAVPVFWTLADSRYSAFAVVLAYKLAASRGLLPGAAVFLSENHTFAQAAALYFLLPFGASLPFLIFWDGDRQQKAMGIISAFLIAYVLPPMSLIGIISPLIASGTVFRGCGYAGMIATLAVYAACSLSRKTAYAVLCVIAMFAVLPPDSWYEPVKPEGIMAVDTSFGKLGSGSFSFERDYERANMVFNDLKRRDVSQSEAKIIVLPETIAGRLNETGMKLWIDGIQKSLPDKTVIFGAELPTGDGRKYDNAAVMLHEGKIAYTRQRIPVPYSMFKGPFANTGANLRLWECGILSLPDGRKAAVIVCYEAFLTWPFLASMTQKPDVIISAANLWWCRETSLPDTQKTAVSLWSLLFGVPAVFVRNI